MLNSLVIIDPRDEAHVAILVILVDQVLDLGVFDCVPDNLVILNPRDNGLGVGRGEAAAREVRGLYPQPRGDQVRVQ